MRVIVRAYSVFRDYIGEEQVIELKHGKTVRDLLSALFERYHIPADVKPVVILNGKVVDEDCVIPEDSVVYITPQFSGGGADTNRDGDVVVRLVREDERLDFNDIVNWLTHKDPEAGAIAMFIGFVKGVVDGKEVFELDYTAVDDMALKTLEKIARESVRKYELKTALIMHRVGRVRRGDVTLIVAAVSTTRKYASRAVDEMVERIKHEVPIFKLEKRSDGEYWVIGDGNRIPRASKKA